MEKPEKIGYPLIIAAAVFTIWLFFRRNVVVAATGPGLAASMNPLTPIPQYLAEPVYDIQYGDYGDTTNYGVPSNLTYNLSPYGLPYGDLAPAGSGSGAGSGSESGCGCGCGCSSDCDSGARLNADGGCLTYAPAIQAPAPVTEGWALPGYEWPWS